MPILAAVVALAVVAVAVAVGSRSESIEELEPPKPAAEEGGRHGFDVLRVATGLNRPTYVGAAPGESGALWVLEQPGRVVRLAGRRRTVLLDISERVKTGAEQGLLGMAFHPDFATNRRLYLHWSDVKGDTRVAELRLRSGRIDLASARELLHVVQPEENHNGGGLAFGPDGRLYLGLGDGGGAFDPRRTAQDPGSRLGKLLSADVDAGRPDWRAELLGVRNPWRFWFDFGLGEIWIGDVGQDQVEEINRVLLEPDEPPKNLGWSAFEGDRRVDEGDDELGPGERVWPVAAYTHAAGDCSVTAGFVYRGTRLGALRGRYLYGDFCSGTLWSLKPVAGGRVSDVRRERAAVPQLTHIGADEHGEPVFASAGGAIYRAVNPARRR